MNPIYLDYNATTPLDPEVVAEMQSVMESCFGNPSSSHEFGFQAKRIVGKARSQVAGLLNARADEIIFTSGGTESNNMALKGVAFALRQKGNHIITSAIEHPAILEVCHYLEREGFRITYLPVDDKGMVDPLSVEESIVAGTILISVMHANNEVGTIQPVAEIGRIARSHGILFHSDAAQSIGKIPVDVESMHIDLLSVAGHKMYAPKGIGAIYIRRGIKLEKLMHGADHESNLRAGTENVIHIAGLGKAAELICFDNSGKLVEQGHPESMEQLRDYLFNGIKHEIPELKLNGHPEYRLPNTLSIAFPGTDAGLLLNAMKEVAASAGAACHSDRDDISGVLVAMNVPRQFAIGTIRFSLGRMSTMDEIERAIPLVVQAYLRLNQKDKMVRSETIAPDLSSLVPRPSSHVSRPSSHVSRPSSLVPRSNVRLTEYTHALGCACKIRPQFLERVLKGLPSIKGKHVLVGHETSDDAAVYAIDQEKALVQTVDFIPPIVDDPYMYGAIAAANSISDVYAMGGVPAFALSIVGFPDNLLPLEVLGEILRGASDKALEAGIEIIGGHTIEDHEPKFGLVVTGFVHPDKILRNTTAKPGDVLILTKPVGTGIVMTAMKRGLTEPGEEAEAIEVMAELNRIPAELMARFPVNACTDVTGFGLIGHLKEMVKGSGISAIIEADKVPVLGSVYKHAADGTIPGGTKNNMEFVSEIVSWAPGLPELTKIVLCDAQTSGGLLISLPGAQGVELLRLMAEAGLGNAAIIGRIIAGEAAIEVTWNG